MKMKTTTRRVDFVTIVDISGQIVLGEECTSLRNLISELLDPGHNKILLNLADVQCIDSAGFAYLIGSLVSVRKRRGDMKLLNPTKRVWAVMQLFKLHTVFEVGEDEAAAIRSFGESGRAATV
jgi:anti-sigma B factor antagonist